MSPCNASSARRPSVGRVGRCSTRVRTRSRITLRLVSSSLPPAWSLPLFLLPGLFLSFSCHCQKAPLRIILPSPPTSCIYFFSRLDCCVHHLLVLRCYCSPAVVGVEPEEEEEDCGQYSESEDEVASESGLAVSLSRTVLAWSGKDVAQWVLTLPSPLTAYSRMFADHVRCNSFRIFLALF